MNFQLLWIDALLISLLWVAPAAATAARLERRWERIVTMFVILLMPLAVLGAFVVEAALMKFSYKMELNGFDYALSLILAYGVGACLILVMGARRHAATRAAAASWPRAPLAAAWFTAVAIGIVLILNMDLAVRVRCATRAAEIRSLYLASLPAMPSEAQNAAPLYEKAFARLSNDSLGEHEVNNPPFGESATFNPHDPGTIAFLNRHAPTIALLRMAAALPACRFAEDLADPDMGAMTPMLSQEREAANVLNLDARQSIARGDPSAAVADAVALFAMGRQFGRRPMLVSVLTGLGIGAMGNSTLEKTLPAIKARKELQGLGPYDHPDCSQLFQQALRSEECRGLDAYGGLSSLDGAMSENAGDHLPSLDYLTSGGESPRVVLFRTLILDPDNYIRLMENMQVLSMEPYYGIRDQLANDLNARHDLLTSIVTPSLSRLFEVSAQIQAADACADVAVAMTRYRLDHGTPPAKLSDLIPGYLDAVPTDPFDGKPLRLTVRNGDRIIYSVGPDGVDDGGVELERDKGDVIFTLKSSPAAPATRP